MKNLIEMSSVAHNSIQSIIADEVVALNPEKATRSSSLPAGLTCLGVTIIKDSKLCKLQDNQPMLLSNSNSESDSLLNEIVLNVQQRCKLVDNVFPGTNFCYIVLLIFFRGIHF